MFGMFQGRDRALSSPASGSGLSRRIVRDIIPSGCWVCNSNSEKKHLLSGSGLFPAGIGNNCSGSGRWDRDTPGNSLPAPRIFPGSISFRPAESRARSAPGMTTRTIVRRAPGCPVVPGAFRPVFSPAYRNIKKFILGVDTLYSMG